MASSSSLGSRVASTDVLDPVLFAESRLQEIRSLTRDLVSHAGGMRRVFQTLPKHMRRRAMSHNPHLVPRYMRKRAQEENATMNAPERVPRKRRKVLSRGKQLRRQAALDRLPSDTWCCKRMRMGSLFGFRMPIAPNDKLFRHTLRSRQRFCTVFDCSYLSAFSLSGSFNKIWSVFKPFVIAPQSELLETSLFSCASWTPCSLWWKRLLSPALIFPARDCSDSAISDGRVCWVFIHPSAVAEIHSLLKQTLESVSLESDSHVQLSEIVPLASSPSPFFVFHLSGPSTARTLSAALQFSGEELASPPGSVECYRLHNLHARSLHRRNTCFPDQGHPFESIVQFISHTDANPSSSTLLDSDTSSSSVAPLKTSSAKLDAIFPARRNQSRNFHSSFPLCVASLSSTEGAYVFGPRSCGPWVWKRLVDKEVCPLSLQQRIDLALEEERPLFPFHTPQSVLFDFVELHRSSALISRFLRRPASKRSIPDHFTIPLSKWIESDDDRCCLFPVFIRLNSGSASVGDIIQLESSSENGAVGHIMHAGFSLRHGRGCAFGFIDVRRLSNTPFSLTKRSRLQICVLSACSGVRYTGFSIPCIPNDLLL